MDDKNKRILWLINHQTLMEFEPTLLESLGYEVYIPKLFPQTYENRSAGVTFEFDNHLTLPESVIVTLNDFNFYTTKLTPKIRHIINSHFRVMVVPAIPLMLQQAMEYFEGHIVLRAFGHAKDYTYGEVFKTALGPGFPEAIERLGPRFHFGTAYRGMELIEQDYLKRRMLYLPLGLPDRFFSQGDVWEGNDWKLLFICPIINESTYYTNIYHRFKDEFKNIPHVIGGWQSHKIDDPTVIGSVDRKEFDGLLRHLRVMFYHSEEPRHIHFHPLEAIAVGMPVVFMQDGMLGQIDKNKKQPGAAKTVSEAKKKIRRILAGDQELADQIRSAQKDLLIQFTRDYCLAEWQKNFVPLTQEISSLPLNRSLRIAVMLPAAYKTGTFDAAKRIAKMIHKGSRNAGTPVDVVFSFLRGHYNIKIDFTDLSELGISLRETIWEEVDRATVARIMRMEGHIIPLDDMKYLLPRDEMRDFLDMDKWLIVSDSLQYPPAPLRHYGVVILDCLSRYFAVYQSPIVMNGRTGVARGADFILTTTPQTREDVISFHGISPDRVVLAPIEFGMDYKNIVAEKKADLGDYFAWPTNIAPHKNHLTALEGLIQYYSEGGKLDVIVTGPDVEQLDINFSDDEKITLPNIKTFREKIRVHKEMRNHFNVKSHLSKREYYHVLKNACFVWNPALLDNGTFTVVEAAALGVSGISSDYPQMRYIDSYFGLNLEFFDPYSSVSIAEGLHHMENTWKTLKTHVPPPEQIQRFGWENLADNYWHIIEELL
jgi:glycosyltransferase involved in cell wall biosynthesis